MIHKSRTLTPEEALARLEDLCVSAEHCEGEMREKMRKWRIMPSEADKIVDSLRKRKFIDDRRFADAYVRDKYRFSRWGKRKIAMALAAKHVDRDIVAGALDSIDHEEYHDIARSLLNAKIRLCPDSIATFEGRTKLYRFLIGRGYEPSLASSLIKEACEA